MIPNNLPTWLDAGKDKYDLRLLWDWIKFNIRSNSIIFSKVGGIILRARARWHEHGEKNSKYFLNLEKRNHVKKHVRKLHISGVISTDSL